MDRELCFEAASGAHTANHTGRVSMAKEWHGRKHTLLIGSSRKQQQ